MRGISPPGSSSSYFGSGFGLPSPSCFWLGGSRFGCAQCSFGYHFVAGCDLVAFALRSVQSCLWFLTSLTRTVLFCSLFFKTSSLILYLVLVLPTFLNVEPHVLVVDSRWLDHSVLHFASFFCSLIVLYVTFLATIC
jgi:hypothetical protein